MAVAHLQCLTSGRCFFPVFSEKIPPGVMMKTSHKSTQLRIYENHKILQNKANNTKAQCFHHVEKDLQNTKEFWNYFRESEILKLGHFSSQGFSFSLSSLLPNESLSNRIHYLETQQESWP